MLTDLEVRFGQLTSSAVSLLGFALAKVTGEFDLCFGVGATTRRLSCAFFAR